jgi:hypothetical protein
MKINVYINDKFYRTIDLGKKKSYDPSVVIPFIEADQAQNLLGTFEIETKGLGLRLEPAQ